MDCLNSPSSSDVGIPEHGMADYDSDATDDQNWGLVGSSRLREAHGSYVGALELVALDFVALEKQCEDGTPFRSVPPILSPLDAVQRPTVRTHSSRNDPQRASTPGHDGVNPGVQTGRRQEAPPPENSSPPFQAGNEDDTQRASTEEPGYDDIDPFQIDGEAAPAQDAARTPFPEEPARNPSQNEEVASAEPAGPPSAPGPLSPVDPVHVLVDGPWIWKKVQEALGLDHTPTKVDARTPPYGRFPHFSLPGPWPCAVVACTRFSSFPRDFSKESWLNEVQRAVDASQTLLRFKAVASPAPVFPWIRVERSTTRFRFGPREFVTISSTYTNVKNSSHRLRELQHFLRALPPGLEVWFLSIGIDGLTTELENLNLLRQWYPFLRFHLAVLERDTFPLFRNGLVDGQGVDLCPARPEVGGMRIRTFSFNDLLEAPAGLNLELCMLWRAISDAKKSRRQHLYGFTTGRNGFNVQTAGMRLMVPR